MHMTQKIGIYPGTFDPIHIGHITFSEKTLDLCHLDKVILLPETWPRRKPDASPLEARLFHIKKALTYNGNPALGSLTPASSPFTVAKTFPEILGQFQQDELTLLLGSDIIKNSLIHWQDLDILLQNVNLAIGMRQHDTLTEIQTTIKQIENRYVIPVNYTVVHTAYADMSSTNLRRTTLPSTV